jgi:hypothetical protein
MWRFLSAYIILTVIIRSIAQEYFVVALYMKSGVTVLEDVATISGTSLPIEAAISFHMDGCDQAPLILPKMQDQTSLMLC